MSQTGRRILLALVVLLPASSAVVRAANVPTSIESDICVYGGTSGGVIAAVQAARMGKSVVLAEPSRHLGGMTAGGLSAVDIGDPRSVGGIAREYFTRLAATAGREKWPGTNRSGRRAAVRPPVALMPSSRTRRSNSSTTWRAKRV